MSVDASVFNWNLTHHPNNLAGLMHWIDLVFKPSMDDVWALVFAGFFLVRGKIAQSGKFLVGVVVGISLSYFLKNYFHRQRPPGAPMHSYSFPSGHALGAVVFWGLLAVACEQLDPKHRWMYRLIAVTAILLIGWNRIYLGYHWLTDVIGGYAIGGLFVFIWISLFPRRKNT